HAYDIGFTREQIKKLGRWSSDAVDRYFTSTSPDQLFTLQQRFARRSLGRRRIDGTTFISSSINLSGRSLAHPPTSRSPRTVAPITSISS
ncbi:hypothetical protein E4U44_003795, partial [Claviceps purpurea]